MRFPLATLAGLIAAALLFFTVPASAQLMQTPTDDEPPQTAIEMWLTRLAGADDKAEADLAEQHIMQRWMESGSDTVNLLMGWAMQAMSEKDYPLALDLLDRVVTMKPDFAEGWNKRATVFYMQDEYSKSLADIARTLAIEPRHFGAISGLGMILRELDRNEEALDALKRALKIHPFLGNVPDLVKELERKVGEDA